MSFIDELTKWFDRKQSNVQHLSNITDEQKQKWYDERAQTFVKNYRDAHSGAKIENGRRGDELKGTVMAPTSDHVNDQVSSGAVSGKVKPGIYEFTYTVPSDPNNMDSGKRTAEKGLIYMLSDNPDGNYPFIGEDGKPYDRDVYVYEATLADGTRLTGKEFEDFIASSPNQVAFGNVLTRGSYKNGSYDSGNFLKNKNDLAKQYLEMSTQYVNNPYLGPENPRGHIEWDKQKRMWMAR